MKDHGVSAIKVATLKYDAADIKRRQKEAHVVELAKSIASLGGKPLNPLIIQKKTRGLLAGRDRLAALLINGASMVDCRQVDADAPEAARIERHENLHRRPIDRDKLIAEEIAATTKTIETEKAAAPKPESANKPDKLSGKPAKEAPKPVGRQKTAKGEAREQLAKKLGTSPEAVRKAEARDAKKTEAKATTAAPKKSSSLPNLGVKTFGLKVSEEYERSIETIVRGIDGITRQLTAAQGAVTKLELAIVVGDIEAGALPRLKQLLHVAGALARGLTPAMICPYCKDLDGKAGRRSDCEGCDERGYLSEGKAQGIPPELLIEGEHAMVSDGQAGFEPLHKA